MKPLISIIIPSFNRGALIGETIQSVLSQTHDNWELIIVDDGSSDNSDEMIAPFLSDSRIKYLIRPNDRLPGGNAARNYGYEMASGAYIKWLDSDDLLLPNCLELQLKKIQLDNTDVCFCRSRFFKINPQNGVLELGSYWHPDMNSNGQYLEEFILGQIRFSNNDGLWLKDTLGHNPFFDNLKNSQEFLMLIKYFSKNISVSLIDRDLVLVRDHDERMNSKRNYATFSHNQIFARYLVIKELKKNKINNLRIYIYLLKSMGYYIIQTVKKGELSLLHKNIILIIKAIFRTLNNS